MKKLLYTLIFTSLLSFFFFFASNSTAQAASLEEGCTGTDTGQYGFCWFHCDIAAGMDFIADERGRGLDPCESHLLCCVAPVNRCIGPNTHIVGSCPAHPDNCPTTSFTQIDGDCQGRPEWGPCCVQRGGPTVAPASDFQPTLCGGTQSYPYQWLSTGIGCISTNPSLFIYNIYQIFLLAGGGDSTPADDYWFLFHSNLSGTTRTQQTRQGDILRYTNWSDILYLCNLSFRAHWHRHTRTILKLKPT